MKPLCLTLCFLDCIPGRYFWLRKNINEFYSCLDDPLAASNASDDQAELRASSDASRLPNAVRVKCVKGTYMCDRTISDALDEDEASSLVKVTLVLVT